MRVLGEQTQCAINPALTIVTSAKPSYFTAQGLQIIVSLALWSCPSVLLANRNPCEQCTLEDLARSSCIQQHLHSGACRVQTHCF